MELQPKPVTHYAVLSAENEIVFSTSISEWGDEGIAKSFLHEHINDAVNAGIDGAAKYIVRGVIITNVSHYDEVERLVEHLAILSLGINGDKSFRDIANDSWASLPGHLQSMIEQAEERFTHNKNSALE